MDRQHELDMQKQREMGMQNKSIKNEMDTQNKSTK